MSIPLNSAATYGVLSANSVISTGNTTINGDIGVSPGTTVTGFPPGSLTGSININTDEAATAVSDALSAYIVAISTPTTQTLSGTIGNQTLVPGTYEILGDATITGTLTLDGQNLLSPNFIFKVNGTLTALDGSIINMINGAGSPNTYWAVTNNSGADTAVNIGIGAHFHGTLGVILGDIVLGVGARADAVAAIGGNVILNTNDLTSFQNYAPTGGDPHCICLDGSRLDVYDAGFYRLFDNCIDKNRMVVNAEVRRDPFDHLDFYHQIWVEIHEPKKLTTCHVEFETKGLRVDGKLYPEGRWEKTYVVGGICYKLICESHYNTVMLSTPRSLHPVRYSGLMAGQILPLKTLKDQSSQVSRFIQAQYYDQNALMAGSVGPHVITVQKKSIYPKNTWYRLLQWDTSENRGIINIKIDDQGQVREMFQKVKSQGYSHMNHWQWDGADHWDLSARFNGHVVNRSYIHEQEIVLGDDQVMLLRVQGNGSISASFRKTQDKVRGLLFGDMIETSGPYDDFMAILLPLRLEEPSLSQKLSIYQRHIELVA